MDNINRIKIENGEVKINNGNGGGSENATAGATTTTTAVAAPGASPSLSPSPSLSISPSSYKTCEEYVLASLEAYKKKAALVDSYVATLATLKEIFFVVAAPDGINIGVHDELLDIVHDSAAIARIMLLKTLFETTAAPVEDKDKDKDKDKDGDLDRPDKLDLSDYKAYTAESAEEVEALNLAEAYKDAIYNESEAELDLGSMGGANGSALKTTAAVPSSIEETKELDLDQPGVLDALKEGAGIKG